MHEKSDILFISWQPYCSRSDGIAGRLGGKSVMVYSPFWGSHYSTIAFKYLSQIVKTLFVLFRNRPRVVFVMTPPVVACIPVWIYCVLTRSQFVIDAHTGAFLDDRWRRFLFVHRFFSRRAATTIVTSRHFQQMIESWGARSTIITDVPLYFAEPAETTLSGNFNMTLVCSFTYDEPTDLFFEAAARVPEISFHVTGNYQKLPAEVIDAKPANVRFTGFLDDADYVGLLSNSDAVIALTTCDHTMQRGAYEAIYLGKPVITSDYQILRDAFNLGTVHVGNTVEALTAGFQEMVAQLPKYTEEATQLRTEKLARWDQVADQLRDMFQLPNRNSQPADVAVCRQDANQLTS